MNIGFNRPYMTGEELQYIKAAYERHQLSGDGLFSTKCQEWLELALGCKKALLTHSCTAALEMSAILANIRPGDEVIMPSFTFVSTANAFVLRGATPVFVDIRPDTLNIDEQLVSKAVSQRTKAIVPVHYAGVPCEMDLLHSIAKSSGLAVIEDAAQAILSSYKGKKLGSIGSMATLSFHETKNITCGEGGALLINDEELIERAEIIREKGTNRTKFFRREVAKYTWVDIGSSFLPGEILAAFLYPQLLHASNITSNRVKIWQRYYSAFENAEKEGKVRRPIIPEGCEHNGHLFYLLLPTREQRDEFINHLRLCGIDAVFHYVPLHSSPFGEKICKVSSDMHFTNNLSERLVRLPLWVGIEENLDWVVQSALQYFE